MRDIDTEVEEVVEVEKGKFNIERVREILKSIELETTCLAFQMNVITKEEYEKRVSTLQSRIKEMKKEIKKYDNGIEK